MDQGRSDARKVFAAQGVRAFIYGFGTVRLGITLDDQGLSGWQVGIVLGAVLAGTALMSVLVAKYADRVGRRTFYVSLYGLLAVTGVVFAFAGTVWVLAIAALSGAMSTEVIESGPFTSLEQSMLASSLVRQRQVHGFGFYNAVAAVCGSLGALAGGLPQILEDHWASAPQPPRWFLLFLPTAILGAFIARSLSSAVERHGDPGQPTGLGRSRPTVKRLAGLFALDSFAGGLTVSAFIAYWLHEKFDASDTTIGVLFFCLGLLQAASFLAAPRLADRFGLLETMVFTHLPSNVLLACVAFAPNLGIAIAFLTARTVLSQMDVPTRQAYVMALVDPDERTPAAAYTNTARYLTRPFGPPLAAAASQVVLGLPFVVGGAIKSVYDLTLWRWFRTVPLPDADQEPAAPADTTT